MTSYREQIVALILRDLEVTACHMTQPPEEDEIRSQVEGLADAISALPVVITDEMVERAAIAYLHEAPRDPPDIDWPGVHSAMRTALRAALCRR